jgi:hypothetical protein
VGNDETPATTLNSLGVERDRERRIRPRFLRAG